MVESGFRYDATFGFSSRNGFRLGVADLVPAWSAADSRVLPLEEVPLTWMDRALSKYAGVEAPGAWVQDALALMDECAAVEGLWVGLWHPNLTAPLGFVGAECALEVLVAAMEARRPWTATLERIVDWRLARRGLRLEEVSADGRVRVRLPRNATDRPALEDVARRHERVGVEYRQR